MTDDTTAPVGHNNPPLEDLAFPQTAAELDAILAAARAALVSAEADISTGIARKEIASRAYKASTLKTRLDVERKEITAEKRHQIAATDALGKRLREGLDEVRDAARKPLTEWEAEEERKKAFVDGALSKIRDSMDTRGLSPDRILERAAAVRNFVIGDEVFGDRASEASMARDAALSTLMTAHAAATQAEKDRAELERLRNEEAERAAAAAAREEVLQAREAELEREKRAAAIAHAEAAEVKARAKRAEEAAAAAAANAKAEARRREEAAEAERVRAAKRAEMEAAQEAAHRLQAIEAIKKAGGGGMDAGKIVQAIREGKIIHVRWAPEIKGGESCDLAPALSVGDVKRFADRAAALVAQGRMAEAAAESVVRRMAHGLAERSRALRLYGNGVHPLAAGYAWRSLSYALGLRPVDLGAAKAGAEASGV